MSDIRIDDRYIETEGQPIQHSVYTKCYCYRSGRHWSCRKPVLPQCEAEKLVQRDEVVYAEMAQLEYANQVLENEV